jgi:hypothetical protein
MTDVPSYKPRETSFPKKRWLYYQMEENYLEEKNIDSSRSWLSRENQNLYLRSLRLGHSYP